MPKYFRKGLSQIFYEPSDTGLRLWEGYVFESEFFSCFFWVISFILRLLSFLQGKALTYYSLTGMRSGASTWWRGIIVRWCLHRGTPWLWTWTWPTTVFSGVIGFTAKFTGRQMYFRKTSIPMFPCMLYLYRTWKKNLTLEHLSMNSFLPTNVI